MNLGAFSVSLSVKDINLSRQFYEKLGFAEFGGDITQNWLILKNGDATVGLFQGMFEGNILTFNPGWDANAQEVEGAEDIRSIQEKLKGAGLELTSETEGDSGPASLTLVDPDGNAILLDQHV